MSTAAKSPIESPIKSPVSDEGAAVPPVQLSLQAEVVGAWVRIHMLGPGQRDVWVTNEPTSEHYRRGLYRSLRDVMQAAGGWPAEARAVEEELQARVSRRFKPIKIAGEPISEMIIRERREGW